MAASVLPPPLREGDRLTRDEFMRRWEAMPGLRWAELIDGVVYLPSPVSRTHDDHHFRFSTLLGFYVSATPGLRGGLAGTWLMSDNSAPQPDLTLEILPEYGGQAHIERGYSAGAPELVAEISHTTDQHDSTSKLLLYERSGVCEYVTARTQAQQIVWRFLEDGKYTELTPDDNGIIRSRAFPGLWLDTTAFWNAELPALAACVQRGIATPEHAEFVERLASQKR